MENKNLKGSLQFLSIKKGGKKTAIHSESRLKLTFEDSSETFFNVVVNFAEVELALPGEHVVAQITFAGNQNLPKDLYAGMSFKIFDLTKHIGQGTIIEMAAS